MAGEAGPAMPPLQRMVLVAALLEAAVAVAAFAIAGAMAMVAAVIGSSLAIGAQIAAVVMLRPAMKASQAQFQQRWVLGMAVRFASFVALAAVMIVLKDRLPVAWLACGYLSLLLVLLYAETRFLK